MSDSELLDYAIKKEEELKGTLNKILKDLKKSGNCSNVPSEIYKEIIADAESQISQADERIKRYSQKKETLPC